MEHHFVLVQLAMANKEKKVRRLDPLCLVVRDFLAVGFNS